MQTTSNVRKEEWGDFDSTSEFIITRHHILTLSKNTLMLKCLIDSLDHHAIGLENSQARGGKLEYCPQIRIALRPQCRMLFFVSLL